MSDPMVGKSRKRKPPRHVGDGGETDWLGLGSAPGSSPPDEADGELAGGDDTDDTGDGATDSPGDGTRVGSVTAGAGVPGTSGGPGGCVRFNATGTARATAAAALAATIEARRRAADRRPARIRAAGVSWCGGGDA